VSDVDVSIIIPTRDRSDLLSQALSSALAQEEVRLEVIVVDEGSTDTTTGLLAAIRDPRLTVLRNERPLGVAAARNAGAASARGEWLAFLDDDDVWAPRKLVSQLQSARLAGADWVYTGAVTIGDRGQIVFGRPPLPPAPTMSALRHWNAIPGGCSNVALRRTAWRQAGPFDTRLRNTEDWEMWIRLAKLGAAAWVPHPLVGYRVHETNSSLNLEQIVAGTKLIETMHDTRADWGQLHRWMAESCLRRGQRWAALRQYAAAAARGQARGVLSDLSEILSRRLGTKPAAQSAPPEDRWIEEARTWLRPPRDDSPAPEPHEPPYRDGSRVDDPRTRV
jgi:glycosyltransferase involved in cell wall biosynthesis